MSITAFSPSTKQVAGFVDVAMGAGFASLATPKLSELSLLVTCSLESFESASSASTRSVQPLCSKEAVEVVDSITRNISSMVFKGDGVVAETAFLALVGEGNTLGVFVRPYKTSIADGGTAIAVGDKGDAFNCKVRTFDRGPATVGSNWTYVVQVGEVKRSALNVALIA